MPKIALAPIVVLWFGTGLISKVALAVSLTALVALIAAYQAAKDADVDLQSLMISMGADKHQVFYKAVVPSTLPSIIARPLVTASKIAGSRWLASFNAPSAWRRAVISVSIASMPA